jgi:hypothetical protein
MTDKTDNCQLITGKSERGQSLIELAFSMIILLILLAGIVDLGRAILTKLILQDAAEEGIIYGTSFPTDCNQIESRIRDNVDDQIVNNSISLTINIEGSGGTYIPCFSIPYAQVYAGKDMNIEITYVFPISMPFLGTILGSQSIPINVTANGTILRPPPPTTP